MLYTNPMRLLTSCQHGIIILTGNGGLVGAGFKPAPTTVTASETRYPVTETVRSLKTFSGRRINQLRETPGVPIWQRSYCEHVIRNEDDLPQLREYILNNRVQWELEEQSPKNLRLPTT